MIIKLHHISFLNELQLIYNNSSPTFTPIAYPDNSIFRLRLSPFVFRPLLQG